MVRVMGVRVSMRPDRPARHFPVGGGRSQAARALGRGRGEEETWTMASVFDEAVLSVLDGKNFAIMATVGPDGGPHSSVVWFKREDDTVVFSTIAERQKARNLAADPRVSISVFDLGNPYTSVEIRGTAELVPDDDKRLSFELSHRYLGVDPPAEEPAEVRRLIVRVTPEKVIRFSA
jgi:PPOX class probable F420-dependent enzyme